MAAVYTVNVELIVSDRAALAAHAKARALDAGLTAREYTSHEAKAYADEREVEFWLGWVFDNGSPPGLEIQDTSVESIEA